jgi:hypothetical protein
VAVESPADWPVEPPLPSLLTFTGAFVCTEPAETDGVTSPTWTVPIEPEADWLWPSSEPVFCLAVESPADWPVEPPLPSLATFTGAFVCTEPAETDGVTSPTWTVPILPVASWAEPSACAAPGPARASAVRLAPRASRRFISHSFLERSAPVRRGRGLARGLRS